MTYLENFFVAKSRGEVYRCGMKLHEYLESKKTPAYRFAREHGLVVSVIYKLLRGRSVQYATAKRISEATGGEVTIDDIYGA